jgi:hypothetical protein
MVRFRFMTNQMPARLPRIFMTKVIDSQGNEVLIQYDSDFRITTITDSIGQVSTISYVSNSSGNPGFYKVASITDPFSRTCQLRVRFFAVKPDLR